MSQVFLRAKKCYPVQFGEISLCMASCKVVGACVLTERATASNHAAVTASWPKGTRLTLQGKLAPEQSVSGVIAVLAQYLQDGTGQDVTVDGLVFADARLTAYTVSDGQETAEVMLQLYTAAVPVLAGSDS